MGMFRRSGELLTVEQHVVWVRNVKVLHVYARWQLDEESRLPSGRLQCAVCTFKMQGSLLQLWQACKKLGIEQLWTLQHRVDLY